MQILCIEDNDVKFNVIKTIIAQDEDIRLIQARCGNDGLLKLSKEEYELLVLDMSLPINIYSKDTNMLYGVDILEEIRRMRSCIKVFVITGFDFFEHEKEKLTFEELYEKLQLNYKRNLVGMVRYDQLSIEWAITLKQVIDNIKKE